MIDNDTVVYDSEYVEPQFIRDGAALAVWALTMTMLVGAVMVAGVAFTAMRLRIARGY